ncbi:MAG: hypothetical protein EA424_04950 [Planctomycetaceae bacterium]|nr:MAG: hypothetical protein EA424_04950 [Planctomycetaceae bacterium]
MMGARWSSTGSGGLGKRWENQEDDRVKRNGNTQRAKGRWSEASRFKDSVIRELRQQGMKKTEAADEAWLRMAAEYPAVAIVEFPDNEGTEAFENSGNVESMLDRLDSGGQPNLVHDTWWVYEHLEESQVSAMDCPSLGAWSLLCWARQYRSRFFEQFLPKLISTNDRSVPTGEVVRPVKRSAEEIHTILHSFADVAKV